MVNKVILIGNLGRDPDIRDAKGTPVTTLNVATSERWKDKQSGEQKEKTEWHRVICWGPLAENCGKYLVKGSKVYVEGQLETREWDKDGTRMFTTEIRARDVQFLSGKSAEEAPGRDQGPPDLDDDIPF